MKSKFINYEKEIDELSKKIIHLQTQLANSEDVINAIKSGEVDAFIIKTEKNKPKIFSLHEAEHPYRIIVESMYEGAVSLIYDGTILYSNKIFAKLVNLPLKKIAGSSIYDYIPKDQHKLLRNFIEHKSKKTYKHNFLIIKKNNTKIKVFFSASRLLQGNQQMICIVITDLAELKNQNTIGLNNVIDNLRNAIKNLEAVNAQLFMASRHDLLTGLLNRKGIEESLDNLIAHGKSKSIALLIIDIDRFKMINDTLGHEHGDTIIKSIAARLSELYDHKSVIQARLGGDTFILYFSETNKQDALNYAEMIHRRLGRPFILDKHNTTLTTSIGIVIYPNNGLNAKTLIENADLAMIQAKNQGGNRINFFSEELSSIASNLMKVSDELRQAITHNQLILDYQPQIDLKTGNIIAAEALVRWNDPVNGLIYPDKFISIVEKMGLIISLNEYVMRMVFQQISLNPSMPKISINISAAQLSDGFHLVEYLESLIKEYGVSSHHIELEITENMLIENAEHSMVVLKALHELGFQIAVDDFGTGYSSFKYIGQLPFQKLKIDKLFITGLPGNLANADIIKAMIILAHSLNKIIVAEGVESKAEVDFLMENTCDIIQGYYYYKPMSLDDLLAILAKSDGQQDTFSL